MILKPGKETVLVLSDIQAPFHHPDTLRFLEWVNEKAKPTQVVCIGDEVDMHALSDYDHDPDGLSAGDELKKALKFMHQLYAMFPNVKSCLSNHTARPLRKAFKAGIPKAYIRDYKDFLEAPKGWDWGQQWEIDGVLYEHGEGMSGSLGHLKAALGNGQSTVIGHLHSHAGINYTATERELIFGFNVGCLIDVHAYAFEYGRKIKSKPVLGVGVVDKGVPVFIPMLLGPKGRWIKPTSNKKVSLSETVDKVIKKYSVAINNLSKR